MAQRRGFAVSILKSLHPARLLDARPAVFYAWIAGISLLTGLLLWFGYDRTFDGASVRLLYRAANAPASVFEWILHPFAARADWTAVGFLAVLHMLAALLFVRISERVGIGRHTVFLLFILLNFSPEYNGARLDADPFIGFLLLWLAGVWWFLRWYEKSLTIGFIGWAVSAWLSMAFSLTGIVWALGFPLMFLFWPRGRYQRRIRFGEREKFILVYYLLVLGLIFAVPYWRNSLTQLYQVSAAQMNQAVSEMSLFMSPSSSGVDLDFTGGYLIALLLTAVSALKTAGILAVFLLWISWKVKTGTVLNNRVRRFFFYSLGFFWLIAALSLLYQGFLPRDITYLPAVMLLLWLGSSGAYYAVQRLKSGNIRPERLLITVWILAAYALASVIQFGPSSIYEREAGEWAKRHADGRVYSNSRIALYYAGRSPLEGSADYAGLQDAGLFDPPLQGKDVLIIAQSRRRPPPDLTGYQVLQTFKNPRGDTAYVLKIQ